MIVFNKVTKKFPDGTTALDDISFTIDKGGFVFLVGPSGAGKTTISRLLIGEFSPSQGRIFVDNEEITKIKKVQIPRLRRKIGVAFQDFKMLWDRTVKENISLPLEILSQKDITIKDRVTKLLSLVGLEQKINCFPRQLSGGEIQRVVIARALAHGPKILFADEPTGNLDQETGMQIIELLKKINEQGTTIVISTHNNSIMELFPAKILHLKKGRLQESPAKKKIAVEKESKELKETKETSKKTKEKK